MNTPMEDTFDAYHIWLGIPRKNQPPNHYCLLGIELFEESTDAILNAADQRMDHLRGFQIGPHSALSQKLLNQVAAARLCLLDPAKKAAYDRSLQGKPETTAVDGSTSHTNPKRQQGTGMASSLTHRIGVNHDRERHNDEARLVKALPLRAAQPADEPGFAIDRLLGGQELGPSSLPRHVAKRRGARLVRLGMGGGLAALSIIGLVSWRAAVRSIDGALRDEIHQADHADMAPGDGTKAPADPSPYVEIAKRSPGDSAEAAPDGARPTAILGAVVGRPSPPAPLPEHHVPMVAGEGRTPPSPPAPLPKGEGSFATREPACSAPNDFDQLVGNSEKPRATSAQEDLKASLVDRSALTPGSSPVSSPTKLRSVPAGELGECQAEPAPAGGKLPLPSPEAQREIAGRLAEELGLAAAKTPDAKLRRAEALFQMSGRFAERPNDRFVLLRTIADFAGQGGDASLVMAAVDATAGQFQMDALTAKESLLKKFATGPVTPARVRSFVRGSRPVIDQAVAAGNYEAALGLANLACQLCKTSQGKEYRREASQRRTEVQKAAARYQQIQAEEETLQKEPDNGPANLLLGRWYCTAQKDWPRGIRCLAKGADAELQGTAQRDLASSPTRSQGACGRRCSPLSAQCQPSPTVFNGGVRPANSPRDPKNLGKIKGLKRNRRPAASHPQWKGCLTKPGIEQTIVCAQIGFC